MGINVTAQPGEEPVTVAEAKAHLNIPSATTDHDTYITNLVKAARQRAERFLNRAIVTQTIEYTVDEWPDEFILPRAPVQSITSVTYVDSDGNTQSFTDYQSDLTNQAMPMVKPAYNSSWPSARNQYSSIKVTYVAGYGGGDSPSTLSSIPEPIRQAILLMVGTMFEYREEAVVGASVDDMPVTAENLLAPYRVSIIA